MEKQAFAHEWQTIVCNLIIEEMDLFLLPIDNAIEILLAHDIYNLDSKDYVMLSVDLKRVYYELIELVS